MRNNGAIIRVIFFSYFSFTGFRFFFFYIYFHINRRHLNYTVRTRFIQYTDNVVRTKFVFMDKLLLLLLLLLMLLNAYGTRHFIAVIVVV